MSQSFSLVIFWCQGESSRLRTVPRHLEGMSLLRLYEAIQYFLGLEMKKKIVNTR